MGGIQSTTVSVGGMVFWEIRGRKSNTVPFFMHNRADGQA